MAFTVTDSARHSLYPTQRRAVAPPKGLPTLGFDPTRFRTGCAGLLPGLLAATRTGLTLAGDDELMSDHDHIIDLRLSAHSN
jgi:hypothetical protein